MKVIVNTSRLTDSPYSKHLRDAFVFEDEEAVSQTVQEIKNANPSSFLVSGYRGVGKTSFVNRVSEKLGDEQVTICISLAKYEGYPTLIKKLIRHIYLSFSKLPQSSNEELIDLNTNLELLYDRTFNEISFQKKSSIHKNSKRSSDISIDLKKIFPLVLTVAAGLNISIWTLLSDTLNILIFILSILWVGISSFNIKLSMSKSKSNLEEISRKTLYDDEIAEYHLFKSLKCLKENQIRVLIVFDELDKVKSTKAVEEIISELKALLLSGYANFFVVAGQGLYYQLEKSHSTDDPIISSLFSKTIHVPFPRYSTLKKYCLNLVDDEDMKKREIFNFFFDSLILQAARIPRKLSNKIRNALFWEDGESFVLIDEGLNENYALESKLLQIITKIMDNDLRKITNNQVKHDFFIAQIHLWLHLIKQYRSSTFTINEIVRDERYDLEEYPESFVSQLVPLCELFFDRLVEENVLEVDSKSDESRQFKWTSEEVDVSEEEEKEDILGSTDPDFVKEFIDLEQYVRGIYVDLIDEATWDNSTESLKQMLEKLIEINALKKTWNNSNVLNKIIDTRNKVVHGISIEKEDLNIIQNSRFDISRLKAELIEDYTFYVTKKYLTNYKVSKESRGGFDFVAESDNHIIVFEVKYLQYGGPDSRNIMDIIDKFTNHLQVISPNSHYVLFFYQPKGRKSYDSFYSKFFDTVNNKIPELSNRFHLYYTSEYRGDASTGRLETYLAEVVEKINDIDDSNNSQDLGASLIEADYEVMIKKKAEREWPDDYRMQVSEIEKQMEAVAKLNNGRPKDISEEQFLQVRKKAAREWPDDFRMRVSEEERQFKSIRKLKKNN